MLFLSGSTTTGKLTLLVLFVPRVNSNADLRGAKQIAGKAADIRPLGAYCPSKSSFDLRGAWKNGKKQERNI